MVCLCCHRYTSTMLINVTRWLVTLKVTKVKETVIRDLLFAEDCALNANKEQEMQMEMIIILWTDSHPPLTTSGSPSAPRRPRWCFSLPQETHTNNLTSQWKGRDCNLSTTSLFTYLVSTLSLSANVDVEVTNGMAKASTAFGRLKKTVWERRGISQRHLTEIQNQSLQSSCFDHTLLQQWNLDHLQAVWKTSVALPSSLSSKHPQPLLTPKF
mgnify:CR=1 FL=1